MMGYAISACSLAQMRKLESVASTRRTVISASQRTRQQWFEAAWCIVVPLASLPLFYVVAGHRYDIVENIGCVIPTHYSWVGVTIKLLIPIVISVAVLIYSGELRHPFFHLSRLVLSPIYTVRANSLQHWLSDGFSYEDFNFAPFLPHRRPGSASVDTFD